MSRRNIKPTTFHDDSRSSDAGSVIAAPARSKPRTIKDPSKDLAPLRDNRVAAEPPLNGIPTSAPKLPPLGPDGEIQVFPPHFWVVLIYRLILRRFQSMHYKSINIIMI